jgi:hypothetical protein
MLADEHEGLNRSTVYAISPGPKVVVFALKCTAQVGLTALYVLQHSSKRSSSYSASGMRSTRSRTGML